MKVTGVTKWTKENRVGTGFQYSRSGLDGRNSESDNAHIVEVHWNYNGSGPEAFGGADKWPVVSAHVSFVEGEEQRAEAFGTALRDFIDRYLDQPTTIVAAINERERLREALRQVRAMFFEHAQSGGYMEKGKLMKLDNEQHPWIPGAEAPRAIAIIDAALLNDATPSTSAGGG